MAGRTVQLGGRPAEPFRTPPPGGRSAATTGVMASAGATREPAPVPDKMPLQPGKVSKSQALSPAERQALEGLGWQEGDPIPAGLADALSQAQVTSAQSAVQGLEPPVPLSTPPMATPISVDIATLPDAKQREIRELLENAKRVGLGNPPTSAAPELIEAGPGVREAAYGQVEDLEVVDDRKETDDHKEMASSPATAGGIFCPRCGWDMKVPDHIEPTSLDKQAFIQSVLGGIDFRKLYQLLGGQMEVCVRTLSPLEVDLCFRQAALEFSQGKLANLMDRMEQNFRYQACLQITSVRTSDNLVELPESINDYQSHEKLADGETQLPFIAEYVQKEAMGTESRQRILRNIVLDFNRLVAKLEANVSTPGFWAAVAG